MCEMWLLWESHAESENERWSSYLCLLTPLNSVVCGSVDGKKWTELWETEPLRLKV